MPREQVRRHRCKARRGGSGVAIGVAQRGPGHGKVMPCEAVRGIKARVHVVDAVVAMMVVEARDQA